jgi:hypothetical protein
MFDKVAVAWDEYAIFAVISAKSNEQWEKFKEHINSAEGGSLMPAFTFEKIMPPARHSSPSPTPEKQRGLIVQILDRFVEARAKKSLRKKSLSDERSAAGRRKPKSAD